MNQAKGVRKNHARGVRAEGESFKNRVPPAWKRNPANQRRSAVMPLIFLDGSSSSNTMPCLLRLAEFVEKQDRERETGLTV